MTLRTLTHRSLRFHWRAHLGVVLGAAVGSAALIGALVVGDSVRESLRENTLRRLGPFDAALHAGDRLLSAESARRISRAYASGRNSSNRLYFGSVEALLKLNSIVARTDGTARANNVNLYGCDERAALTLNSKLPAEEMNADVNEDSRWDSGDSIQLNENLAAKLRVVTGDYVIVRFRKPTVLHAEAAVSPKNDSEVALRFVVRGLVPASQMGDLSFYPSPSPPLNAFVSIWTLGKFAKAPNMANGFGAIPFWHGSSKHPTDPETLTRLLSENWRLRDLQLALEVSGQGKYELRTPRVFLDPPVIRTTLTADTNAQPILTYLTTLLHAGTNTTPYSMVTAAGSPWTPADMRDKEILVSQWLADDLQVKPGDEIALSYFLPESGAKLTEGTNTFRVRGIVPMEMPWADRTLMPDFPGIEKAESTSDWDAGFPLTYKIREKDEEYWKNYRGTPKAFITLAAGQKMWGNRFGNLTAIRFPIPTNVTTALTPALSPGERENHSPIPGETKTGDGSTAPEKSRAGQQLSPLPVGEGQGEGERKPRTSEPPQVAAYKQALEKKILANLKPEELGLRFEPVREQALKAAEESQDFGGLFLGFSFFVIAAALLLMALLFSLGLEQRAPEIGTLLALGFTPKQVRRMLLREGVLLSLLGGILGTFGGLAYAKAMLHGLTTIWRDAVGASALSFHFTAQTVAIGLFASVVVSALTIWLTLRKFVRRPARELLVGEIGGDESNVQSLKSKVIVVGALLTALVLVAWAVVSGNTANAGIFFGAGALVLVAGLAAMNVRLVRLSGLDVSTLTPALSLRERENHTPASSTLKTDDEPRIPESSASGRVPSPLPAGEGQGEGERAGKFSLAALGFRGCARRRKRSLSTVAMLACGSFLIVSIGVFRLDANRDAWKRTSGTGGFALIGETTMPVVHDLNTQAGRDFFALNEKDLAGVQFVPFRVREGDEASCLNLNRAQKPRLLGVKPELMKGRFAFAQTEKSTSNDQPWWLLKAEDSSLSPPVLPNEVPAIGDANSIQWAMHKKVGDTIDYVDERGQPFKVRIVGAVANSVLQGQLIIDETRFVQRFPGESGYRMFLIDAPSNAVSQVSATLSRALQDVGLELTPAAERLAQFNAVQNTYLGTFQVLGGLGLLLGSVGLGIVVLRNVLERRGELAVMLAVGFRKATLQRLLLIENGALLVAGLALGVAAAAVAVLPALLSPGAQLPLGSLALTLGAVLVNGALWTWAATRLAVRGDLLKALRNE